MYERYGRCMSVATPCPGRREAAGKPCEHLHQCTVVWTRLQQRVPSAVNARVSVLSVAHENSILMGSSKGSAPSAYALGHADTTCTPSAVEPLLSSGTGIGSTPSMGAVSGGARARPHSTLELGTVHKVLARLYCSSEPRC
jgi:hypothetical protein